MEAFNDGVFATALFRYAAEQDKYAEAEPLYQEALAILKQTLGPERPNTRIVRENREIFQRERAK